jgi:hypothetical protein
MVTQFTTTYEPLVTQVKIVASLHCIKSQLPLGSNLELLNVPKLLDLLTSYSP